MLSIRDLHVAFGARQALRGISFDLERGETLGIVGESGSGKSVLALATIGLLPRTARATGQVLFYGQDVLALPDRQMTKLRGSRIGMIFQEPMTALNPAMRVGTQIAEAQRLPRAEVLRLLDMVRIPDAARKIDAYPHELSGGQRQRIGIAIALALKPDLLIADEPTTALDVTVQAEILAILDDLVRDMGIAMMLISHDLGVIAQATDRTLVIYRGEAMEHGPTHRVLTDPTHDYTRRLLAARPGRRRHG